LSDRYAISKYRNREIKNRHRIAIEIFIFNIVSISIYFLKKGKVKREKNKCGKYPYLLHPIQKQTRKHLPPALQQTMKDIKKEFLFEHSNLNMNYI
tara:strand:+ start:270 stop:557 length:288 start_codon:yes stop_codon:yes gene_type:complete